MLAYLTLAGFFQTDWPFSGRREIASDCNEAVTAILRQEAPLSMTAAKKAVLDSPTLRHYHLKNTLWSKLFSAPEFESFNENKYFRLLEIYKDERQTDNLLTIAPSSIEEKLALIESIQTRWVSIQAAPSLQDEIESLNVFKLRKLENLLKKFDLSKKATRENLQEFSTEFFLILKGAPVSLIDYFAINKTKRMNERLFRVLQEDMLVRGLRGSLERIPEADFESNLEKATYMVKKIMNYKLWRLLVMPYDLPLIDQIKISETLMEKILLDGLDAHQSELIVELKRQNAIDHYERFRKAYRPVAFGVGFYFYYKKYENTLSSEEDTEGAKQKFMDDFKKLADAISAADTKMKTDKEIKEEQFQRVLKSFKEKYHEPPTSEEFRELRRKIFGSTSPAK